MVVKLIVGWSEVYKLNKRGASTAPCGTPATTTRKIWLFNIYTIIIDNIMKHIITIPFAASVSYI